MTNGFQNSFVLCWHKEPEFPSCPASCRTHWQGMASGLSHQTLRKMGEQGLMCMVEKEEAVWWRTEVILGWETNHPCVLSSKGSWEAGLSALEPRQSHSLGSQLMDSSVQGTHPLLSLSPHGSPPPCSFDLLQREENNSKSAGIKVALIGNADLFKMTCPWSSD